MSSKTKINRQRSAANTAETATMTTNEKILKECHELYVSEETGKSYIYIYIFDNNGHT